MADDVLGNVGGIDCFVKHDATTVPLDKDDATGVGGKVLYGISAYLANNPTTGTVATVNSVSPTAGNVSLDTDDIPEGVAKLLTVAERASISSTATTASGNATSVARLTGQQALTFTTALSFDAASFLRGTVTLTANTKPVLASNTNVGEVIYYVTKQDSTGGRFIDWDNFIGEPDIDMEQGSTTIYEVYIESATLQHVSLSKIATKNTTERALLYTNSTFDGLSGGAIGTYNRVVTDGVWTWPQAARYQYQLYSDLTKSGPISKQSDKDKLALAVQECPNTKFLSIIRQDLWNHYHEDGIQFAAREWGTIKRNDGTTISKPTFAMGSDLDDATDTWATAQAAILSAGYTQVAAHDTITSSGTLMSLPYEIALKASNNTWWARNSVMDISDLTWLDLYADMLTAQRREEPSIAGYYITFQKIQQYRTSFSAATQLHEWLEDAPTHNPGWVLATNSGGGTQAAWGSSGDGTVSEIYDDRHGSNRVVEVAESAMYLINMLKNKDPGCFILFSPYNLTVEGHRAYKADFRTRARVKYAATSPPFGGGTIATDADADDYWQGLISMAAAPADAVEFAENDDAADFSVAWAQALRNHKRWVRWTKKPQDISTLADF